MVLENLGKPWNWEKKIPGPGKSLNLVLVVLENPGMGTFNCKRK